MAQTEHLPIYKASYDLCLYWSRSSRSSPASIGMRSARSYGRARAVLRLVVLANARRDKAPVLLEVRETVEEL